MTKAERIKSRLGDMVCDLLSEIDILKKIEIVEENTVQEYVVSVLIVEKEKTLEKIGNILKEFA